MSALLMGMVWESKIAEATLTDVLLYLANCANDEGSNCFPGVARIAQMARVNERTVQRALRRLEDEGWIAATRTGGGKGVRTEYQLNVVKLRAERGVPQRWKGCQNVTVSAPHTVTLTPHTVTLATPYGDIGDNPPDPLFGVNVKETSGNNTPPLARASSPAKPEAAPKVAAGDSARPALPLSGKTTSTGAQGEFLAAHWLLEELSMPATPSDLQVVANLIRLEARRLHGDAENAARWLLGEAQRAIERGAHVTVFWLKDKRYLQEANGGKAQPSTTRTRVDGNRTALAKALAERRVEGPWSRAGAHGAPVPVAGSGTGDRRVSGGLRAAGGEVRPADAAGGPGCAADRAGPEVLPAAG